MKLHDVPRHTWVRVLDEAPRIPPGSPPIETDNVVFFEHIDGMYSYCKNRDGEVVHLAAWTEVEVVWPIPPFPGEAPGAP